MANVPKVVRLNVIGELHRQRKEAELQLKKSRKPETKAYYTSVISGIDAKIKSLKSHGIRPDIRWT